jgi:FkbM family methyltransferase
MLNFIKRTLRTSLDRLGFDLRRKKLHEQADDPYHAISILLDKEKTRTIVDAGASIGDISQKLTEMFPLATVHAIEPYPPFHAHLEKLAFKNKRIRAEKLALSDENGSKVLQINKSEGTNSLLRSNEEEKAIYGDLLSTTGEIRVKCQSLDEFLHENSIEKVDLLKLDLQGSELPALTGASEALSEGKIKCILCEIMFQPQYESQPPASAILNELMGNHDYMLFNLYQHHHHHGYLCQTDALLFHSSINSNAREKAHLAFHPYSAISFSEFQL